MSISTKRTPPTSPRPRGSVVVYMLLMMGIVTTGVVTTLAVGSSVQTQISSLSYRRDLAYYAAEAGMQRALWELEYGSWRGSSFPTLTGSCVDTSPSATAATYSVTVTQGTWNSPIYVTSVGAVPGYAAVSSTIKGSFAPTTVVPAISIAGNLNCGGGVTVTGDIQVAGSLSHNGNFTVTGGNIIASGTIDTKHTTLDPGYGFFPNSPNVTVPIIDANALATTPGAVALSNSKILDFTSSSSGVLVYNGDLTLDKWPTVIGNGTLIVLGNLTIAHVDFGTNAVNIVARGAISTQPQVHLNGSIYAGGAITAQAQLAVTGVIVSGDTVQAGQILDSWQGQTTVNIAPPPWFDPRITNGSGSRYISNFQGPAF